MGNIIFVKKIISNENCDLTFWASASLHAVWPIYFEAEEEEAGFETRTENEFKLLTHRSHTALHI